MARNICDVGDPAPIVLKYIDQVAAYLATWQRVFRKSQNHSRWYLERENFLRSRILLRSPNAGER